MQKNIKVIIAGCIGTVVGILGTIGVKKYSNFSFADDISFEINPLEFFSLIINVALAIYVARTLSRRNDQEKSEKDLIINYLKEFHLEYKTKTNKLLSDEEFDTPISKSCFKTLRIQITSIIALAEENCVLDTNDQISIKVKQQISEIWMLFTDTPKMIGSRANQATKEAVQILRLEKIVKIETASIELAKLIFQLSMKINKK